MTNSTANYLRVIQGGKARIPATLKPLSPETIFEQCRALSLYGKHCYVVFHLDKNNQIIILLCHIRDSFNLLFCLV
jgi:hypothetical protein